MVKKEDMKLGKQRLNWSKIEKALISIGYETTKNPLFIEWTKFLKDNNIKEKSSHVRLLKACQILDLEPDSFFSFNCSM